MKSEEHILKKPDLKKPQTRNVIIGLENTLAHIYQINVSKTQKNHFLKQKLFL